MKIGYKNEIFLVSLFAFLFFSGNSLFAGSEGVISGESSELRMVENNTGLTGWKQQGVCAGDLSGGGYKLIFYSPPRRTDVGGYGVLEVTSGSGKNLYSGYDFYPFSGGDDCSFIETVGEYPAIILDTENWSYARRYVVYIDLSAGEKTSFSYSLKKGNVFKKKMGEGSVLIAGFGLCPSEEKSNWVEDMFCEEVGVDVYKSAERKLADSLGFSLQPEVPDFGKGAFRYYILPHGKDRVEREVIKRNLSAYFSSVFEKVESLDSPSSREEYYEAILALHSIGLTFPEVGKEIDAGKFMSNDVKGIEKEFDAYWEIIY